MPPATPRPRVSVARSVRTRLTLWYLAVMAFIIFMFGGSLYGTQAYLNAHNPENQLEPQLYQDSQQFAQRYSQALAGQQPAGALPLNPAEQELVLLLAPDGAVLDQRGPLTGDLIAQLQASAAQNPALIDLTAPQADPHRVWGMWAADTIYRVLITPVLSGDVRVAVLVVGLPRSYPVPFLAIWIFWGGAALLVAALGGYWLAGQVLRPVKTITRLANEIGATDLRRRLDLPRKDEFGQLAATFDQMLARLEAAFKRQAQFTADASHELRTPLTIIGLEINRALTQVEQPEDYRRVLEQIQAENEQVTAIVNSLLLLARADAGQMTLERRTVDLSDVALASVERLLPLANWSQVTLATGELAEALVCGDAQYLGQMLNNLLENGIKYTRGVGQRVSVEVAGEQGWGVVRVRDDGAGISAEHVPHVFERFYRADPSRARSTVPLAPNSPPGREDLGGSGLGLSIVKWIVEAHGGTIQVTSQPGAGSLFEVRLPLLGQDPPKGELKGCEG